MLDQATIEALTRTAGLFAAEWKRLDDTGDAPVRVREVRTVIFDDLRRDLVRGDQAWVREMAEALHAGDGFVVKGVYPADFLNRLRERFGVYCANHEPDFHKMFDDAPDFHRFIEQSLAGKYGAVSIRHVFHCYNWNDDPLGMVAMVDSKWPYFKVLSGNHPLAFTTNKPRDGVIDRYHVYHYPSGGGSLETHSDPPRNQRTILAGMMSKRGEHYQQGGFYFVGADGEHLDVEPMLDEGDKVVCYATVQHGVAPVDPDEEVDWDVGRGRWLLGLYSVDSDYVKNRDTIVGVSQDEKRR